MKKWSWLIICFLVLMPVLSLAGPKEIIAIAAEGKEPTAQVSKVAARAPAFLLFDGSGKFLEALHNPLKSAARSAGPLVVDFLASKGVTTLVAGGFGAKMVRAMQGKGIRFLEFEGSAKDAVQKVLSPR
jgi:predicted Fe-Mo cluster-binding NifX family protein